jgi:hypothetical protein
MKTCKPFPDALATINRWYDEGHQICFLHPERKILGEITETWLTENGFRFHSVLLGKPRGEIITG